MYHKQKKLSQFLLLTVNVSSQSLVSTHNSIGPPQAFKGVLQSVQCLSSSLIRKKKISRNHDSLSLVATRCHSLPLVATCCTTRCLLLSLVVLHCHLLTTRCHSLSLDVPLACLLINDRMNCSFLKKIINGRFNIRLITKLFSADIDRILCKKF